ncbi:MAG: GAF domain-containing protein [Caldilinea sp. CFX5]|nr:GAF domain-containing protein [Caldilinea sp. CFX5]
MSRGSFTDTQRDAEKYRLLVRALRHATMVVRAMEEQDRVDIREVLTKLLPDVAAALGAQKAFVIRQINPTVADQPEVEMESVYPPEEMKIERGTASPLLQSVLLDGRPRVLDTLDDEEPKPILGLEFFNATSAILVRVQIIDQVYIVGVCNKRDREAGPFLASDRITLDNMLELIAIGARTSEQRRRELDSIEHISRIAAQGSPEAVAREIVQQAVRLTRALYAELWAIDKHHNHLDFVTAFHKQQPKWAPHQTILLLTDETLGGYVAHHQQQRYAPDVSKERHYAQWGPAVQSAFCVPLRLNEQTLGVLFVASEVLDGINREERRFIEQLAPHAAIALHNARLQEVRQQVITFLQDVTNVLPLQEQFALLLEQLPYYVDTSNLFLASYDTERNEITFPLAFERGEPVAPAVKRPGQPYGPRQPGQRFLSFPEWVLQHRKTLLVENFATWPERYAIEPRSRVDVKSCLVVPLLRQERIVGVLGLRSFFADKGSFDEYDKHFLEGIANHIAIVLDNSRRYDAALLDLRRANDELQLRIQELKAVSTFQQRISDLNAEEEEIENIYTEALHAMAGVGINISNMYIALYDQQRQQISFPLAYEEGRRLTAAEKAQTALYRTAPLGEHGSVAEWVMKMWQLARKRNALVVNYDFKQWARRQGIRIFPTNTKAWLGAPMIFNEQLVGVIGLRSTSEEEIFKESHLELLEIIASQAAIAITNARLYAASQGQIKELQALNAAAGAITRAGVERDAVLQTILEQAINATGAFFGTLQLAEGDHLQFITAWPLEEREKLWASYGRMPLNGPGLTVRTFNRNDAQLVPDVKQDPDFLDYTGCTGSALVVVLRRSGENGRQPIGVLNVEHAEVGRLTETHRKTLIALANLAAVAIENADQAVQLSRSNAIAIMGAWGADIVHDIHREVAVVRLALATLRLDEMMPRLLLLNHLQEIDQAVSNLVMPVLPEQLPEPGRARERQDIAIADAVIRAETEQLQRSHAGVRLELALNCPQVWIQMHELWLRRLLRHLVKNAIRANVQAATPFTVQISTSQQGGMVELCVRDNGRGVRPEIAALLFNRPIPHTSGPGNNERSDERFGRGLLLVRHIVELHGGHVWLKDNIPGENVCFAFTIPEATTTELVFNR